MKAKTHVITLRVPKGINKQIDSYAATKGISKNAYLLTLIDRALRAEQKGSA